MGRAASSSVTTLATSRARLSWGRLKLPRRVGMSRIAAPSRFIAASRLSMIRSTGLVAEAPVAMSTPPVLLDQLRLEPLGLGGNDPQGELAAPQGGADLVDPGDGPVPLVALPPGPGLGVLRRPLRLGQGVTDLLQRLPNSAKRAKAWRFARRAAHRRVLLYPLRTATSRDRRGARPAR